MTKCRQGLFHDGDGTTYQRCLVCRLSRKTRITSWQTTTEPTKSSLAWECTLGIKHVYDPVSVRSVSPSITLLRVRSFRLVYSICWLMIGVVRAQNRGRLALNFLRGSIWSVNSRNPSNVRPSVHLLLLFLLLLLFYCIFFFFFIEESHGCSAASFNQRRLISISARLFGESTFFDVRVLLLLLSSSAKGRRAHNYSSGSLPNSSSLITILESPSSMGQRLARDWRSKFPYWSVQRIYSANFSHLILLYQSQMPAIFSSAGDQHMKKIGGDQVLIIEI